MWRIHRAALVCTASVVVSFGAELRAQDDDFEAFEAPKLAAILPIDDGSSSPELARLVEDMAARLLVESARYRLMMPWETRARLAGPELSVHMETPTQYRAAAASLGVDVLFRFELGAKRRLEVTTIEREGRVKTRVGTVSKVAELLDRDVGELLEQVGALRPVHRVKPPFRVRPPRPGREQASFTRFYPRVIAYLSRSSHDPSKKLALAEATIAAYSGLDHDGYRALVAARALLLRGRAFFGTVTDAECRAQLDCRRLGTCTGGELSCVATSDVDCRKSETCKKDGRCRAVDGECRAEDATCEQSYACLAEGRCEVHAGICLVPDTEACERSKQCDTVGACFLSFGVCSSTSPERVSVAADGRGAPQPE